MVGILDLSEHHGLCLTCNNAPNCFYRATRGPALFCEMFDDYMAPAVITTDEHSSLAADSSKEIVGEEDHKYVGLCVNCENRRACMHAGTTGGVWHCEEYQ